MAEIIGAEAPVWRRWAIAAVIGIGIGLIYALFTWLLSKYVFGSFSCGGGETPCAESISTASNIATILTAIVAIAIGIRMNIARPLLVALGVSALLWGLGGWLIGLHWAESLSWIVVLYALAYIFFVWLSRYTLLLVVVAAATIIIVVERILLALL